MSGSLRFSPMLTLDELKRDVESGSIDTVVVAFTDMQGRLMGKRVHAQYFLDENIADHGVEGCNYLLALDMEMEPMPGYSIASWERATGTSPCVRTSTRYVASHGSRGRRSSSAMSPGTTGSRSCLAAAGARGPGRAGAGVGYEPMFGSELEFYLLKESYEEAHAKHYRDLTPSVPYILDYHVLATTYDEPLLRQIRNGM